MDRTGHEKETSVIVAKEAAKNLEHRPSERRGGLDRYILKI